MSETQISGATNRQKDFFKFKIQQMISLKDEEITRHEEELLNLKSKIVEKKEILQSLTNEIEESINRAEGGKRRKELALQSRLSHIISDHHIEIQKLREAQTEEIRTLQAQYEKSIAELAEKDEQSPALASIESQISEQKTQLQSIQQSESQEQSTEETEDEVPDSMESERLAKLQSIIEQRNKERVESLQSARDKLNECVKAIEDLERSHGAEVASRLSQIKAMDIQYNKEYQNIIKSHENSSESLKANLAEATERASQLRRAAKRIEKEHQRQTEATIQEIEKLKPQAQNRRDESEFNDNMERMRIAKERSSEAKKSLRAKEQALAEVRQRNSDLKRQIGQLTHRIRFIRKSSAEL